jgi:hypothetical protein
MAMDAQYNRLFKLLEKKYTMEQKYNIILTDLHNLKINLLNIIYDLENKLYTQELNKGQDLKYSHLKLLANETSKLSILELKFTILQKRQSFIVNYLNGIPGNKSGMDAFSYWCLILKMYDDKYLKINKLKIKQQLNANIKKIEFECEKEKINAGISKIYILPDTNSIKSVDKKNEFIVAIKKLYCKKETFLYNQQVEKDILTDAIAEINLNNVLYGEQTDISIKETELAKLIITHTNKQTENESDYLDKLNKLNHEFMSASEMVGGTNYEKYLKYKDKYLKLKNSVISNF